MPLVYVYIIHKYMYIYIYSSVDDLKAVVGFCFWVTRYSKVWSGGPAVARRCSLIFLLAFPWSASVFG